MSLAQAIADAPVPEYNKIKVPLLCVAGQEDQVAQLEDLALIGDEYVCPRPCNPHLHTTPPPPTAFPTCRHLTCDACMPCHAMHMRPHAKRETGSLLTLVPGPCRWGAPSKTELEVLFGVGHWHSVEDADGTEGCLKRFAKKVELKARAF